MFFLGDFMIKLKAYILLCILFLSSAHAAPTILFCGDEFRGGGVTTHVKTLAQRLRQDNFNVLFITKKDESCNQWCREHGIQHLFCDTENEMYQIVDETIKNNPTTIVHFNGNNGHSPWRIAWLRSQNPTIKILRTEHSSVHRHQPGLPKELRLYDIMTFADCTARSKIAHARWTPPLYDDQKFTDAKITRSKDEFLKTIPGYNTMLDPEQKPFIITVPAARISANKNQLCAVKAVAELVMHHAINCHLFLLGRQDLHPSATEAVHKLIRKLHMQNHVHLVGYRTDICDVMHFSDVVVVPTKKESFGLPVIEAALLKKPIIVSNSTRAAQFFIDHNKTGLSFISDNHHDLAAQIMRLYNDSSFAHELGINAYTRAKNEFSTQALYNNFKQIYETLLK